MFLLPSIIYFPIFFSYIIADEEESLLVETKNGFVIGRKIDESVYGWNGIPFAKPPIGDLRFEPPQSPDNWTGIWNATYDRNACITISDSDFLLSFANASGVEDCLYINVYTPQPPQVNNTLLPVMVWIYGGAFLSGNNTYAIYGPDELVQEGTIVVTFNYRLGIFGFLSTNDSVAPGNAGLKDQILALKWIQCNIKAFGGDPSQVTVFGESAGSASVSYLVLSPLTKGLFHRAIMESGTALCLWSLSRTGRQAAFAVGTQLGIQASDSYHLVNALKNVSAKSLERASYVVIGVILAVNPLNGLVFSPVIEPQNNSAVITRSSYEILSKGYFNQVPQLIGYNSAEGYLLKGLIRMLWFYIATYDLIPACLVPASMNANSANLTTIATKIKDFYVGPNRSLVLNEEVMLNYISDNEFARPIQRAINLTSTYVPTYFYRFSYNRVPGALGASHGNELDYLFNSPYNSTDDRFVKKCITMLWTNFAKYGNPTPNNGSEVCGGVIWKPITPQNRNALYYINIDRKVTVGKNPNAANMTFWQDLFDEYAIPPFKTY